MGQKPGHDRTDTAAIKIFALWEGRRIEIIADGKRVTVVARKRDGRMQIEVELPPGTGARTLAKRLGKS